LSEQLPQPSGGAWQTWANRLTQHLKRTRNLLGHKGDDERATEDGLLMWERDGKYPVVSKDLAWWPLALGGGQVHYAYIVDTTIHAATTVDTATAITWNTTVSNNGISIDGTDASRINFTKSGVFHITFTAEMHSESANTKTFYFWPRINGSDAPNTTMVDTLHNNDQRKTICRSAIFSVTAGDYLQAMFATDDLDADLHGTSATAFSPASPSVTLSVLEVVSS